MDKTDLTCNLEERKGRWERSYFAKGGGRTCLINMARVEPGSWLNPPLFSGEKAGLCAIADCLVYKCLVKPWVAHY